MLKFIVPFRCTDQPERIYQLQLFIHTMHSFFPHAEIFIMDQAGHDMFNRGALLNAGVKICAAEENDIICFHDLSHLPTIDCTEHYIRPVPPKTIRHVREKGSHHKLGKIIMIRYDDFVELNGFPNDFFGCGGSNDELHMRILRNGLRIERAEGTLLSLKQIHPPSPTNKTSVRKWERLDWHRDHPGEQGLAQLCEDICTLTSHDPLIKRYSVNILYRIPPTVH